MNYDDIQKFLTVTVKNAYVEINNINIETTFNNNDYVTNCDLIIEKYIINCIQKTYPDIPILSEELNKKDLNGTYFLIDPIDGTANFANNLDIWGIQVAFVQDNECKVSSMYFPKLDILVETIKGRGSFINGIKSSIKNFDILNKSMISLNCKQNLKLYHLLVNIGKDISRVRLLGCPSYSFALVAKGCLDAYILIGNTKYDIDPGLLACVESGAKYYRDNICTIVANSNELIDFLKNEIYKVFK